jgi:hypothetical protein
VERQVLLLTLPLLPALRNCSGVTVVGGISNTAAAQYVSKLLAQQQKLARAFQL